MKVDSTGGDGHGFQVVIAGNGQEAADLYRHQANAIDLVLLDLTMPIIGGEEALTIIWEINPGAKVIILSSGYSEEEVTPRLEKVGFDGFLQKPYKCDELVDQVRRALSDAPGYSSPGDDAIATQK